MKIFLTALLALATVVPATAAKGISVQQLTDLVSSSQTKGQSDKEITRKIADVELTERLTNHTLSVLLPRVSGPLTKDALQTLANNSAFLDPPLAEAPTQPAPSPEEQTASIEKAAEMLMLRIGQIIDLLPIVTGPYSTAIAALRMGNPVLISSAHSASGYRWSQPCR